MSADSSLSSKPSLGSQIRKDKKEEGSLLRWKGERAGETQGEGTGSTQVASSRLDSLTPPEGLLSALPLEAAGLPSTGRSHPGARWTWSRLPGPRPGRPSACMTCPAVSSPPPASARLAAPRVPHADEKGTGQAPLLTLLPPHSYSVSPGGLGR